VLEWIRRRSGEFDAAMKQYLFTERPIDEIEEQEGSPTNASSATLGIGARKER
jgi:hypothetical protein